MNIKSRSDDRFFIRKLKAKSLRDRESYSILNMILEISWTTMMKIPFKKEETVSMTIQEVVAKFNTTPFLFAGSGITRRYYGLPDWIGLLTYFADKVKKDPFAYQYYENKANISDNITEKLPAVASYIEKDFNDAWFNDETGIRTSSSKVAEDVASGISLLKQKFVNIYGHCPM